MKQWWLIGLCIVLGFSACEKAEPVHNAVIKGEVFHHSWEVPGVTIYLKHNTTSFPGYKPELYDEVIQLDQQDNTFNFNGLSAGDYYLYADGFDNLLLDSVRGYMPVKVNSNLEIVEVELQVVEREHE